MRYNDLGVIPIGYKTFTAHEIILSVNVYINTHL